MIVFDPVVDFYILERHEDVLDFIFIRYFAFVEVGVEVLYELSEYGWRNRSCSENGWGFMSVMEFDHCHIMERRCGGCG
jgi:hypothetical protein